MHQHCQYVTNGIAGYGDCLFTLEPVRECDALVIFNTPSQPVSVKVPGNMVFAFMMEPGYPFIHRWMYEGLANYYKVFSPKPAATNVIPSHGFLGWSVNKSLTDLVRMTPPAKSHHLSCVVSDAHIYSGHRKRLRLIQQLINNDITFDVMGRGFYSVDDKWTALAPYRFSIALENVAIPHYFTEKITDCFLSWTIPLYWGCTNLEDYFPPESFIRIDVEHPEEVMDLIRSLDDSEYQRRYSAIEEARRLVLDNYQPLAKIDNMLKTHIPEEPTEINIAPVLPNPLLQKLYGFAKNNGNYIVDRLLQRYSLKQIKIFAEKSGI